jgi:hypothetical protein
VRKHLAEPWHGHNALGDAGGDRSRGAEVEEIGDHGLFGYVRLVAEEDDNAGVGFMHFSAQIGHLRLGHHIPGRRRLIHGIDGADGLAGRVGPNAPHPGQSALLR